MYRLLSSSSKRNRGFRHEGPAKVIRCCVLARVSGSDLLSDFSCTGLFDLFPSPVFCCKKGREMAHFQVIKKGARSFCEKKQCFLLMLYPHSPSSSEAPGVFLLFIWNERDNYEEKATRATSSFCEKHCRQLGWQLCGFAFQGA